MHNAKIKNKMFVIWHITTLENKRSSKFATKSEH